MVDAHQIEGWSDTYMPVPVNPRYAGITVGSAELGLKGTPSDWHELVCSCGARFHGWNSAVCAGIALQHVKNAAIADDLLELRKELA